MNFYAWSREFTGHYVRPGTWALTMRQPYDSVLVLCGERVEKTVGEPVLDHFSVCGTDIALAFFAWRLQSMQVGPRVRPPAQPQSITYLPAAIVLTRDLARYAASAALTSQGPGSCKSQPGDIFSLSRNHEGS
jgi:hypothetical protein